MREFKCQALFLFVSGCRRSELIHYLTIIVIKLVLRPRKLFRDENYELIT